MVDTCPLMGPLVTLFQTTDDVSSGFQIGGIHDIHSLRCTSGVIPLPVYMARITAGHFPHIYVSAEVEYQT